MHRDAFFEQLHCGVIETSRELAGHCGGLAEDRQTRALLMMMRLRVIGCIQSFELVDAPRRDLGGSITAHFALSTRRLGTMVVGSALRGQFLGMRHRGRVTACAGFFPGMRVLSAQLLYAAGRPASPPSRNTSATCKVCASYCPRNSVLLSMELTLLALRSRPSLTLA